MRRVWIHSPAIGYHPRTGKKEIIGDLTFGSGRRIVFVEDRPKGVRVKPDPVSNGDLLTHREFEKIYVAEVVSG